MSDSIDKMLLDISPTAFEEIKKRFEILGLHDRILANDNLNLGDIILTPETDPDVHVYIVFQGKIIQPAKVDSCLRCGHAVHDGLCSECECDRIVLPDRAAAKSSTNVLPKNATCVVCGCLSTGSRRTNCQCECHTGEKI